jgi:hypothetical protein
MATAMNGTKVKAMDGGWRDGDTIEGEGNVICDE